MDLDLGPSLQHGLVERPFTLVDVGARGGVHRRWASVPNLRTVLCEPDEAARRGLEGHVVIEKGLAAEPGEGTLHVTRNPGGSSLLQPNRAVLDRFPDSGRFDVVATPTIELSTLDAELAALGVAADALKLDTQGTELDILRGATRVLTDELVALEVEVEFVPLYDGQALFADVDAFVRPFGFELADLRPTCWRRAAGLDAPGDRGQLVWADALYLRSASSLGALLAADPDPGGRLARALVAVLAYGYGDVAADLRAVCGDAGLDPAELDRLVGRRPAGRTVRGQGALAAGLRRLADRLSPSPHWSSGRSELGAADRGAGTWV